MLNYFSSIALQKKVISALVRLPQGLTANERELGVCPGDAQVIILESITEDLLYNWMPRSENDFITEVSSTEFHITVHPDTTTTYTINATDGICYCSQTTIEAKVSQPVNAGPDVYLCSDFSDGDEVIIGYTPQDNLGYHDFEWTYSSGALSNDESSSPYFITLPGTTTTYTLVDNYCSSQDEVTVHVNSCCTSSISGLTFDPFDASLVGDYWTASELYFYLNSNYPSATYTPSALTDDIYTIQHFSSGYSKQIVINGLFIVDHNFKIVDCDEIIFGPDTKIIIQPNYFLEINNSTIYGCSAQWQGIEVAGNLLEDDGLIIKSGSIIKDAVMAVHATEDSRLNIENSTFTNNYEAIVIEDYGFPIEHAIANNTINSVEANMKSPHVGERTLNAIRLNDVPSTEADNGDELIAGLIITNVDNGINAFESGLVTSGNEITTVDIGIVSLSAQGDQRIIANEITDCNTGIKVSETNGNKTDIQLNIISTNSIDGIDFPVGIYVSNYNDNNIASSGKISVGGYDDNGTPSTGDDTELGNTIYSNGEMGIEVTGSIQTKIDHNKIVMPISASTDVLWGIKANDANGALITNNLVNDPDFPSSGYYDCGTDGTNCEIDNKTAIFISMSSDVLLSCNRTNGTFYGLYFTDDCTAPSFGGAANVKGTTLEWHNDGISLGLDGYANLVMSNQGLVNNGNKTAGNYWKGDGTLQSISNETMNYGSLFPPTLIVSDLNYYNPQYNNAAGTYSSLQINTSGNDPMPCDPPQGIVEFDFEDGFWVDVVENEFYDGSNNEALNYNLKKTLYSMLSTHSEIRGRNATLENFYDTTYSHPIGQFFKVDSLIALLSDTNLDLSAKKSARLSAISINEEITTSAIYESNQQDVNEVFLNTIADNIFSFETLQFSELEDVADQCPYSGGKAVYKARALLKIEDNDLHWNDADICGGSPKESDGYKAGNQFLIFPNPSDNLITIKYLIADASECKIILKDILGRESKQYVLEDHNSSINIALKEYSAGLYLLSLMRKDQEQLIGKVSLVK